MGLPNLAPHCCPGFILNLIPDLLPSPLHSPRPPYSSWTHYTCFRSGVFALTVPLPGSLSLQICTWLPTHFLQLFAQMSPHQNNLSWLFYIKQQPRRGLSLLFSFSVVLTMTCHIFGYSLYPKAECKFQESRNFIFFMVESPLPREQTWHTVGAPETFNKYVS